MGGLTIPTNRYDSAFDVKVIRILEKSHSKNKLFRLKSFNLYKSDTFMYVSNLIFCTWNVKSTIFRQKKNKLKRFGGSCKSVS